MLDIAGPDYWPGVCQTGRKQSPINIVSDEAVKTDLGPLKFVRYDFAYTGTLTNTGHSGESVILKKMKKRKECITHI